MSEKISPVLYFRVRASVIRDWAHNIPDRATAWRLRGAADDLDQAAQDLERYEQENRPQARPQCKFGPSRLEDAELRTSHGEAGAQSREVDL